IVAERAARKAAKSEVQSSLKPSPVAGDESLALLLYSSSLKSLIHVSGNPLNKKIIVCVFFEAIKVAVPFSLTLVLLLNTLKCLADATEYQQKNPSSAFPYKHYLANNMYDAFFNNTLKVILYSYISFPSPVVHSFESFYLPQPSMPKINSSNVRLLQERSSSDLSFEEQHSLNHTVHVILSRNFNAKT
ncbi:hypothetical protein Tco_1005626, partial [Tanacetum coccineum]